MRNKAVVFVALVAGLVVAMTGIAAGGDAPAPTVDPASGPPGTSFTVSGVGCFVVMNDTDAVQAAGLQQEGPEVEVTVDFPTPLTETTNADSETGTWSVTFTVPAGTPPGPYEVSATCFNTFNGDDVSAADFDYPAGALFTVLAETPVAPVVPPTPGAAPAPAVAGAPRFTG